MKGKRQEKILEIIRTNDIETQEELTKKLSEAGFSSTQGTISRDIRKTHKSYRCKWKTEVCTDSD